MALANIIEAFIEYYHFCTPRLISSEEMPEYYVFSDNERLHGLNIYVHKTYFGAHFNKYDRLNTIVAAMQADKLAEFPIIIEIAAKSTLAPKLDFSSVANCIVTQDNYDSGHNYLGHKIIMRRPSNERQNYNVAALRSDSNNSDCSNSSSGNSSNSNSSDSDSDSSNSSNSIIIYDGDDNIEANKLAVIGCSPIPKSNLPRVLFVYSVKMLDIAALGVLCVIVGNCLYVNISHYGFNVLLRHICDGRQLKITKLCDGILKIKISDAYKFFSELRVARKKIE
jgi:hypothetical protein